MNSGDVLTINRAYYRKNVATFAKLAAARNIKPLHDAFAAALPPGARLLDAGCGTGQDAQAFLERGLSVTAFDASPAMVKYCRRRGIDARQQTFQELNAENEFDAVWAAASLLHVPRAEIKDVLDRLTRALRPVGLMYISLWRGKGEGLFADKRFVCRYTQGEFRNLLQTIEGVTVFQAWRWPKRPLKSEVNWLHFLAIRLKSQARPSAVD